MPTTRASTWAKAAGKLKACLDVDYRNHQMQAAPWGRAAHSMVQSWRIIASQGRLDYVPSDRRKPRTWHEAAQAMKASLYARKRERLLDPLTWRFWADHLPNVRLRYVPKRMRNAPKGR
ncbi:hypothetical protein [Thermopirellula anaerolimosa]